MEGSPNKDVVVKRALLDHQDNDDDDRSHLRCSPSNFPGIRDSPFNYVSNFPPMEPVKSMHVAQGFGDLPLLPPPTVFTSPCDVSRAETISSKWTLHGESSQKLSSSKPGTKDVSHSSASNSFKQIKVGSLIPIIDMVPCSGKESLDQDSLHLGTCPSACVGDNHPDSLDPCKKSENSLDSDSEQARELSQMQGSNSVCSHETYSRHSMEMNMEKGKNRSPTFIEVPKGAHLHAAVGSIRPQIVHTDLRKETGRVVQENDDVEHEQWPDFLLEDNFVFELSESLQSEPMPYAFHNSEHVDDWRTIAAYPDVSNGLEDGNVFKKPKLVTFSSYHKNNDGDVIVRRHAESQTQNDWNNSQSSLESVTAAQNDGRSVRISSSGDEMVVGKNLIVAKSRLHQHGLPSMFSPSLHKTLHVHGKSDRPLQKSESSSRACIKPLGIGLHLNTIGRKMEKDTVYQKPLFRNDNMVSQIGKSSSVILPHSSRDQGFGIDNRGSTVNFTSSDPPIACHIVEEMDMDQEASGVVTTEPNFHALLLGAVGLDSCTDSEDFCSDLAPIANETPASVVASVSHEEINQSNVKKRKKSVSVTTDGCKRCKCKKSKCLKLYCDCFAVGKYCMGFCGCQECLNRPEFKDKVIAARQLIESRNPIAFAPRVVWRTVDAPLNIGESSETPTSARHKRGCSCKRSKCLKKYCECYQAGVGCSDGCRCESCQNIFGQREGCLRIEYKPAEDIRWEGQPENSASHISIDINPLHLEKCYPTKLTPVTPLNQYSSQGGTLSKPQVAGRWDPSSPGSEVSDRHSTSGMPGRSQRLVGDNGRLKDRQENSDIAVSKQRQNDLKASKGKQLSPGCDQSMEVCTSIPLSYPSSVTTVTESADSEHVVAGQPLYKDVFLSCLFDQGNCPTPMHYTGNKKMLEMNSMDGICHNIDVETPEIIESTCSPSKVVNAGSPNQKRVSPPHICVTDSTKSTTSARLRSRKFILQSVPGFRSLTPYCESNPNEK